jgi:hypothetical protein
MSGLSVPGKEAMKPLLRTFFLDRFKAWVVEERRELPVGCWARRMGMVELLRPRHYLERPDLVSRARWGLPIYTQLMCYGTPLLIPKEDLAKERPPCRACERKGYRPRCTPGHIFFTCDEDRHVSARAALLATINASAPSGSPGHSWLGRFLGATCNTADAENARLDRFAAVLLDSDAAFEHRRGNRGGAETAFEAIHVAAILFLEAVSAVHAEFLRRKGQRYTVRRNAPLPAWALPAQEGDDADAEGDDADAEGDDADAESDDAGNEGDDASVGGNEDAELGHDTESDGEGEENAGPDHEPAEADAPHAPAHPAQVAHHAAEALDLLGDGTEDDDGAAHDDFAFVSA